MGMLINPYVLGGAAPSNYILLSHFNGSNGATSFSDDIAGSWSVFGGAQLTTTSPPFGSAQLKFASTDDYVTIPSAGRGLGDSDFTISFTAHVDSNDGANYRGFLQNDNIGTLRGWIIVLDITTKYLILRVDTDTGTYVIADTVAFPTGVNVLITATRVSDVLYLLKDGVVVSSISITGLVNTPASPIVSGGLTSTGSISATTGFIGKIDELIIRKQAIWTSFPFTPPTSEWSGP